MIPLNIGSLRHLVSLTEEVDTRVAGGGLETQDTERDQVPAGIVSTTRQVSNGEGGLEAVNVWEVLVRNPELPEATSPIGLDWAVIVLDGPYEGKRLEVQETVDPNGMGEWLLMTCREETR